MDTILEKIKTQLPSYLKFGLFVLCSFLLAKLLSIVLEDRLYLSPRPIDLSQTMALEQPSSTSFIKVLQQSNPKIFNPEVIGPNTPSQKSETKIEGLTLKGTLAGNSIAFAVIAEGEKIHTVQLGDKLLEYQLTEVTPTSATLATENGNKYTLHLGGENSLLTARPQEKNDANKAPVQPPEEKLDEDNTQSVLSLSELREMIDNPQDFQGKFKITFVKRDGNVVGTLVRFQNDEHPLYRLGIRNNDLLTSLNGEPLHSPEDLQKAYRTIRNTQDLTFTVERRGKLEEVRVHLED